jgi:hypothetical protein
MCVCIEYVRFDLNVAIHQLKLLCETPMSTVVELRAELEATVCRLLDALGRSD